jgi:peptidoglycan/xylan/chitin deacetylase (PgdA/CDA1 family)
MIPGGRTDLLGQVADLGTLAPVIASVQSGPRGDLACPVLDQRRTARLLFDAELSGGDLEDLVVEPLAEARRGVLGAGASAPPRFLVRVDEFPHYQAWDDPVRFGTPMFERFHEIMAGAGVPYLIAALPRLSREPLSPEGEIWRGLEDEEIATLQRIAGEGATLALHGRDHRTRFGSPRRHSEMCGLGPAETAELLDQALAELAPHGIRPRVFVPPYNRFDASQYEALAARFEVVCGGPESIGTMGLHATPQWRGEAVYLPAYAPFYGHAEEVLPAAERALERADGLWLPVVLHWGWEMEDGWGALERLAARIAGHAARWEDFLDAVARSEQAA